MGTEPQGLPQLPGPPVLPPRHGFFEHDQMIAGWTIEQVATYAKAREAAATATLRAELTLLREQLAAAQADARRYRWLRNSDGLPSCGVQSLTGPHFNSPIGGVRLDAAIDAALQADDAKGERG